MFFLPEDAVAAIENQFPNTKAAGLARVLRARIKLNAKDYAGAASLLDARSFATRLRFTTMRFHARQCVGANRKGRRSSCSLPGALHQYPTSLRSRDAAFRAAALLSKSNEAAAVPLVLLKDLIQSDDATALLTSAKAYEQTSDQTRALALYRRLYFFAPASTEVVAMPPPHCHDSGRRLHPQVLKKR